MASDDDPRRADPEEPVSDDRLGEGLEALREEAAEPLMDPDPETRERFMDPDPVDVTGPGTGEEVPELPPEPMTPAEPGEYKLDVEPEFKVETPPEPELKWYRPAEEAPAEPGEYKLDVEPELKVETPREPELKWYRPVEERIDEPLETKGGQEAGEPVHFEIEEIGEPEELGHERYGEEAALGPEMEEEGPDLDI